MTMLGGRLDWVHSAAVSWGSAAANTTRRVLVPMPQNANFGGRYRVAVRNTSTGSALTVKIRDREAFGTAGTYCLLTTGTIPTTGNRPKILAVQGWLCGDRTSGGTVGAIDISNNTARGTAAGFTAQVRIRMY